MKLFINNMVCLRCQMVVRSEIEKLDIYCITVEPGCAYILGTLSEDELYRLKKALHSAGLELIDDKKAILIEKIKNAVLEMLDNPDVTAKTNFSFYLSTKLNLDYTYLANIYSKMQGSTIENFVITTKIKRVKELICHTELNLTEISWKLNYSSVAHLSTQFKKVTGITPSQFKHVECNEMHLSMCEL